jgi:hypothetical protein
MPTTQTESAPLTPMLTKQEQFFYDNAGFSWDDKLETREQGHIRSAREYAAAETWAVQQGYSFDCEPDPDADESWMADESQEYRDEWSGKAWSMVMYTPKGEHCQSIGGCYGDSDYKRVVRADLALQQMLEVA